MLKFQTYILIGITATAVFAAQDETAAESTGNGSGYMRLKYKIKKPVISSDSDKNIPSNNEVIDSLLDELNSLKLPTDPDWINSVKNSNEPNATKPKDATDVIEPEKTKRVENPETNQSNDFAVITQENKNDYSQDYAEIMAYSEYMAGNYENAAKYYEVAIEKLDKESSSYNLKKAWYLFQAGNSYKHFNFNKANDRFSALLNEFPNSRWSDFARVQISLVQTYKESSIDDILAKAKLLNDQK